MQRSSCRFGDFNLSPRRSRTVFISSSFLALTPSSMVVIYCLINWIGVLYLPATADDLRPFVFEFAERAASRQLLSSWALLPVRFSALQALFSSGCKQAISAACDSILIKLVLILQAIQYQLAVTKLQALQCLVLGRVGKSVRKDCMNHADSSQNKKYRKNLKTAIGQTLKKARKQRQRQVRLCSSKKAKGRKEYVRGMFRRRASPYLVGETGGTYSQ